MDWNGGNIDYIYQYKDHLGNVRLAYKDGDKNGVVINSNDILSEDNYYPFGLKQKRDVEIVVNSNNKYKYNGKELQDELGLNMYDMNFRQYDPAIGRWVVQDPVTHHNTSPYNAFDNNPVFWADPSGADSQVSDLIQKLWDLTPNDGNVYTYSTNSGSNNNSEESDEDPPKKGKAEKPLNWFKKGKDTSLWEVANDDKKALKGVLVIYAHANDKYIIGPDGENIHNLEKLNAVLIKISPQWKDFVQNKRGKFTLVLKACNTGAEGGTTNGVVTNQNIARDLSFDKKGLTVIAPSGFYITSPPFLSNIGINFEVGVNNENGEDTWNVYYNGSLVNKFND